MKLRGIVVVSASITIALIAIAMLSNCGGELKLAGSAAGGGSVSPPKLGDMAGAAANCPNLATQSAIAQVDFEGDFGLKAEESAKLASALRAAVDLRAVAQQVREDLKGACGKLAEDLGANPGNTAQSACKAAAEAIGQVKAKAQGKFVLDVLPPKCAASVEAMGECAAECDATIEPGKVDVKCQGGKLSGRCDAKCKGSCDMDVGASCKGRCSGECTAEFKGECKGECDGKCNGKATNGSASCKGKCEGSCSGGAKGKCGGECKGECKIKGAAECEGTCTGSCSVEMKAPHCTGEVKPPKMSAECKAECDARVSAKLQCTKPRVVAKFAAAVDGEAATLLANALRENLPEILKVSMGMKKHLVRAAGNIQTIVKGAESGVQAMAAGTGAAAARLTTCVAGPFKGAFDAAANLKANVQVSVKVQASASAKVGK